MLNKFQCKKWGTNNNEKHNTKAIKPYTPITEHHNPKTKPKTQQRPKPYTQSTKTTNDTHEVN